MTKAKQPRQRDDVHEGFIEFYKRRNMKPPKISKWFMQFTSEEFNKFAAACEESALNAKKNDSESSKEHWETGAC